MQKKEMTRNEIEKEIFRLEKKLWVLRVEAHRLIYELKQITRREKKEVKKRR